MILRIDRLAIELPAPGHPSPNSASAVQELVETVRDRACAYRT